ncbi:MAG: potassium transporter [Epsilonproteobacteria bacterium]|jgi:trk system potassium uptake protein TrkH|nr:potassium transporter [Campylobacterota bacterium]NPA89328.1 TrkH family potassium uptake protein [Campylobacterota bacterium]
MDRESLINILRFLSLVGIIIDVLFYIPIITGWIYGENVHWFAQFTIATTALFATLLLYLEGYKIRMKIRDAILSVNLTWILAGIMGAVPLMIETKVSFANGFFEAISGFTTTGATIYSQIEELPKNILMLRSVMHWIGGLGIIVLGIGLLAILNPTGSFTLFKSESTGISTEKIAPKMKQIALLLWKIYLLITLLDIGLLKIEGMTLFDAINHAFSTVSTGGFSTKNASLGYWDNNYWILWTTTFFMFISGINFLVHIRLIRGSFSGFKGEEVRVYTIIFILFSVALGTIHYLKSHDGLFFSMTHSFFTIASILTTTGFATLDYTQWGHLAIAIIFVAMLIGGNAGSTAGGVKVIRILVMVKNLRKELKKVLYPNAVVSVKVDGKPLSPMVINNVSAFIIMYILTNLFLFLYLYANGYDTMTSLSAAIACVGNIGPGFGQVGPVDNFAFFTGTQKIVLAFGMIAGRLEFFTLILPFLPEFWNRG